MRGGREGVEEGEEEDDGRMKRGTMDEVCVSVADAIGRGRERGLVHPAIATRVQWMDAVGGCIVGDTE